MVLVIRWSSTARLDDYYTLKALRRQIALVDKGDEISKKSAAKRNEHLANALTVEVEELIKTLKVFGLLSDSPSNMRKETEVLKRIREDLGDVFLCSLRVANELNIDVSGSIHEKIADRLQSMEQPEIIQKP